MSEKCSKTDGVKIKNKTSKAEAMKAVANSTDIQFKSGMIFDLEM